MAWKKPDAMLSAHFDSLLPTDANVERRKMFGCPSAFVGGNMFAGVFEDQLILRLPENKRTRLIEDATAEPFMPMGRVMREYVAIKGAASREPKKLASLVGAAFEFAAALPAKQPKRRTATRKTLAKRPAA
jgi:TfoX/Sxy family transcriptional regulator of competence genes